MTTSSKLLTKNNVYWTAAFFAILAGLVLTLVSWMELCSSACEEVHFYKFFGMDFELLGFIFFPALLIMHVIARFQPFFYHLVSASLAASMGSELNFIRVQKYVVGHWCPICLSIAASVAICTAIYIAWYFHSSTPGSKGFQMRTLQRGFAHTLFFIFGFTLAFVAVVKPEKSFADDIADEGTPYIGNSSSPIDVYIITDWFCPACKKKEATLQQIYPEIAQQAKLYFIDLAIHPETMNFLPYNLSFMVREKDKYFAIRRSLEDVAEKTKNPTLAQVQEAVSPHGVSYEPLGYADIDSGRRFFEGIADTFQVDRTPTVVIANPKKLEAKKLVGNKITNENVLNAIKELQ